MNEYKLKTFKEKLILANFKLFYFLYYDYTPNLIEELILGVFELFQILSISLSPIVKFYLIYN
jgi:hypothetical protein